MKATIGAKQYAYDTLFSDLVAKACLNVLPKDPTRFNVDNVRVVKITGGSISDAFLVRGAVVQRDCEGTIKEVKEAKVAVFTHGKLHLQGFPPCPGDASLMKERVGRTTTIIFDFDGDQVMGEPLIAQHNNANNFRTVT